MNIDRIVPGIRINNRKVNLLFFEQVLGLKTHLEEGAYVELAGHQQKETRLLLVESPGTRTRAVEGLKKLARLTIKADDPREIEGLLGRGIRVEALYRGKRGYGFEALSPEGDCILLHAEDDPTTLVEIEERTFSEVQGFRGLSHVVVEEITIHSPYPTQSRAFYQNILDLLPPIVFEEGQGEDLAAESARTWDLESLRLVLSDEIELASIASRLTGDHFIDKKGRFIHFTDPSNIDVWIEQSCKQS